MIARLDRDYDITFPVIIDRLWWQEKGLSFTTSGYGSRIPTQYKVKVNNKWRRVYCKIYSNIGMLYIGDVKQAYYNRVTIDSAED